MVYVRSVAHRHAQRFEVDSTESIWYRGVGRDARPCAVLKLTPQSQYGINGAFYLPPLHEF